MLIHVPKPSFLMFALIGAATLLGARGQAQEAPRPLNSAGGLEAQPFANVVEFNPAQLQAVFVTEANNSAGATLEPVDESLRVQLDLPKGQGLVVTALAAESPAAQAGILANDILLTLNEKPLAAAEDVAKSLKDAGEAEVALKLVRGGKTMTLPVRPRYRITLGPAQHVRRDFYIGVPVRPLDDAMRSHLNLPPSQGLVATEIVPGSPAAKAGLKPHDILLAMNEQPLPDTETLIAQIQATEGKPAEVVIVRSGKNMKIQVTPERRPLSPEQQASDQLIQEFVPYHQLETLNYHQNYNNAVAHLLHQRPAQANQSPLGGIGGSSASVEKRLDALLAEIKELHKAVDELQKAMKK